METAITRLYEGMFLFDTADATSNWDGVVAEITGIIEKRGGQIESLKKWDERKLAYEINKKSRGTYVLAYFKSPTSAISAIERDVQLSELIMRAMFLSTERMSEEDIKRPTPLEAGAAKAAAAEAKAAEEAASKTEEKEA